MSTQKLSSPSLSGNLVAESAAPGVASEHQKSIQSQSKEIVLPSWFGKLPGMGDFAYRRLPDTFRQNWDAWLQRGLAGLRIRHPSDWVEHFLGGPLWYFALGAGTVDTKTWLGILMPSVDGVGRYFPLTLVQEFNLCSPNWWSLAAAAALEALEKDFDALRLEESLQQRFVSTDEPCQQSATALAPQPGQSLWYCDFTQETSIQFTGLPHGSRFDTLFGFAAQTWPFDEEFSNE